MLHQVIKIITDSLASIGISVLLVILIASLISFLTGNASRAYQTLSYAASVVVANRTISLEQLAHAFGPRLLLAPGDSSPRALTMWWEAIDAGDAIALVYHPVWQDEQHPVPLLHSIYRLYRAIVYGTPVRDVEYIQINVNRRDGSIQRIRYEGSSASSYNDWVSKHTHITVGRFGTQYIETVSSPNDVPEARPIQISGPHLRFGIASWSHQFTLLGDDASGEYTVTVNMPLEHLTEEDYKRYKLARRSQGDFTTKDSAAGRAAKSVLDILTLGVPYFFLQLIRHIKPWLPPSTIGGFLAGIPSLIFGQSSDERLHYTPYVQCPYCTDSRFEIEGPAGTDGLPPMVEEASVELEVLPYARDVNVFDPVDNQRNSEWTQVGKDFYGVLNWDRFLGILQVKKGRKIYYCVARCPNCGKLMDVFANLTKEKPFSEIWQQLLESDATGSIRPYNPNDMLTRLSGNKTALSIFLLLIYFGSMTPQYFQQQPSNLVHFLQTNSSVLLVRGTMTVSLFLLLSLRHKYMQLFRDSEGDFQTLFKLRDIRGLTYWSNFAVSRFTGYQRQDRLFTLNGVVLLGGISSVAALLVAWALAQLGILATHAEQNPYVTCAELVFWLVVAYLTGIVVWNLSIIPHYILKRHHRNTV